jgi:23S rRNA pseudouridine1911/1915/1917 synthase
LVLVNGKKVLESKFVVRKGDEVAYQQSVNQLSENLKATNTPLKILYNNHGLLIIDKPAGMVVHPGAGFKGETLASALLYQFENIHLVGEEHRPGIVHRLDKDTSGIILVARTQAMYEHLKNAFAERKIKKEYLALVMGKVEKPHGLIDLPIGKSPTDFRKQTVKDPQDPKEALTEYKVLEYLEVVDPVRSQSRLVGTAGALAHQTSNGVDECTLLLVKLHTGRTHQIRVHLSSIGHPLIGDDLYGGRLSKLDGLSRQFLHAKKIEVKLPDGTWIEAESQVPEDLRQVLITLNSKIVNQL